MIKITYAEQGYMPQNLNRFGAKRIRRDISHQKRQGARSDW